MSLKPLTVRSGQGDKDRCTTVPAPLTPLRHTHLARGNLRQQQEVAPGHGAVYLPPALARQSPQTATAGGWP